MFGDVFLYYVQDFPGVRRIVASRLCSNGAFGVTCCGLGAQLRRILRPHPPCPVEGTSAGTGQVSTPPGNSSVPGDRLRRTQPSVLGDLLEPFTPPLVGRASENRMDRSRPVLDSLQLLRERQAGETPLATLEEAPALMNTSPETNAKILSALGRLPASDDEVDWEATIYRHSGVPM